MLGIKLKLYITLIGFMVLYSEAFTSVWQVKPPLCFPYTGVAAVLQPRTFSGREDINLNFIT